MQLHYSDVIMSVLASQVTSLTIVYLLTFYSGTYQRKHQGSASLAFVWGIHRWPVNSPHKGPVTWKMYPFDDVIMTRTQWWIKNKSTNNHECSLLAIYFEAKMFMLPSAHCIVLCWNLQPNVDHIIVKTNMNIGLVCYWTFCIYDRPHTRKYTN